MAIVDSLLTELGYKYNDKDLKKFERSTKAVTDLTKKLAKAATLAAAAISAMTFKSAADTDQRMKQSRQINMEIGELDALHFAMEQATGSSDGMFASLEQFSIRMSEAVRGTGSGVEALGILGLSVTDANGALKDNRTLLLDAADALNGFSDQGQRLELADKLGIKDLNVLLQQGSQGINALTNEAKALGVITQKEAKEAEAFNDEWNRLLRVGTSIVRMLVTDLIPVFMDATETVRDFIAENKKLISSGLESFFKNLTFVLKGLAAVLSIILVMNIGAKLLALVSVMKKLTLASMMFNASMVALPILVGLAAAAAVLIIEDIITAFRGGESFFGDFVEKLKEFELFNTIVESAVGLVERLVGLFDRLSMAFKSGDILGAFEALLGMGGELAVFFGDTLLKAVKALGNTILDLPIVGGLLDSIKNIPSNIESNISSSGNAFGFSNPLTALQNQGAFGRIQTTNNNTTSGDYVFNINGGDQAEVRRTVESVINGKTKQAKQELTSNRKR